MQQADPRQFIVEFQMPNGRAYQFGPYSQAEAESIRSDATPELYTSDGVPVHKPFTLKTASGGTMTMYMQHFCAVAVLPVEQPNEQGQRILTNDRAVDAARKLNMSA